MHTIYRTMIVVSLLTYYMYVGVGYVDTPYLSEEELNLLSWGGHGAIIQFHPIVHWGLVFIWLPLAIGMWFYNSLSRKLYLILAMSFLMLNPFVGYSVSTGYEMMFYQTTTFLDGAILAMAYFTNNISNSFKHT